MMVSTRHVVALAGANVLQSDITLQTCFSSRGATLLSLGGEDVLHHSRQSRRFLLIARMAAFPEVRTCHFLEQFDCRR